MNKFKINLNTAIMQESHKRKNNTNMREDTSFRILSRGHTGSGTPALPQAGTLAGHLD